MSLEQVREFTVFVSVGNIRLVIRGFGPVAGADTRYASDLTDVNFRHDKMHLPLLLKRLVAHYWSYKQLAMRSAK